MCVPLVSGVRYSILLVDFDGTLASTLDSFVYAARRALEEKGFSVDLGLLRKWLVKPFDRVVERLVGPLDESTKRRLVDRYVEIYEEVGYTYVRPNNGAAEVLRRLVDRGVRVGVVTSRTLLHGSVCKTLKHLSLDRYVGTVVTAKDVERPKPYPDQHLLALRRLGGSPQEAFSVGDSPEDIQGSKGAGIRVAAYTGGFHTKEELAQYGPDYIIGELTELLPIFEAF